MTSLSRQIRTIVVRAAIVTATVSLCSIDFVWSACSAPVANIGALDFQSSVFKYCDGTNWLSLSTPSFPLQGPNGSVAAPTYSFSAGTNTGMYSTGAGTVAFATGGTQRLVIDSSGNVGIGTATPWSKLHLKETMAGTGSQTTSYFEQILQPTADLTGAGGSGAFYASTTIPAGTRKFRSVFGSFADMKNQGSGSITDMNGSGGYVENVGTTKISSMSGIHGGAYQNIAAATITNLNGGYFYSESDVGTVSNVNGVALNTWAGGGSITNMIGLLVSTLKWGGTVTNRYGVYIDSPGPGDTGVTNEYGVYQEFATAKNYFAGNVGIGTTSPNYKLEVAGTITSTSGGFRFPDGTTQATAASITTSAPVATTSGTTIDITGIPAAARRIVIMFNQVSVSGTSNRLVQVGNSGGVVTSGYLSSSRSSGTNNSSAAGFILQPTVAADHVSGFMELIYSASGVWMASHSMHSSGTGSFNGGGMVTGAGTVDRIRITTVGGADTFDNGSVNISYY